MSNPHNASVVLNLLQKKMELTVALLPTGEQETTIRFPHDRNIESGLGHNSLDAINIVFMSPITGNKKRVELPFDTDEILGLDELLIIVGAFCSGGQKDVVFRIYSKPYTTRKMLLYTFIILYKPDDGPTLLSGWAADEYLEKAMAKTKEIHTVEVG